MTDCPTRNDVKLCSKSIREKFSMHPKFVIEELKKFVAKKKKETRSKEWEHKELVVRLLKAEDMRHEKRTIELSRKYRILIISMIKRMIESAWEYKSFNRDNIEEWSTIERLDPEEYDPYQAGRFNINLTIMQTGNPKVREISGTCLRFYWEEFELTNAYRENDGNNFEHDLNVNTGRVGVINRTIRKVYDEKLGEFREIFKESLKNLQN